MGKLFSDWQPLNFASPADMAAIQKCLGIGGAAKVQKFFCHCCEICSDVICKPRVGIKISIMLLIEGLSNAHGNKLPDCPEGLSLKEREDYYLEKIMKWCPAKYLDQTEIRHNGKCQM